MIQFSYILQKYALYVSAMLNQLFNFFFSRSIRNRVAAEQRDFQKLNELAPIKGAGGDGMPATHTESGNCADQAVERSVICREAVLNRKQRVVGYEFMLRGRVHDQIRLPSRRIHDINFYNEVMINHLLHSSISKLLGHRQAFVNVHCSFLANPILNRLPGKGVVLTITLPDSTDDESGPLLARVNELKKQGFRLALEECFEGAPFEALAPHADYFMIRNARHNPARIQEIVEQCNQRYRGANKCVAREIESFDDFQFCSKLGFSLFQGSFVTRREDWTGNQVGPQTLHVCDLLNHLRREAEIAELALLLKQDAVLSYRLLRYINSAASGLREPITSIEHALVLMGRQKMYRWLTLILFGSAQNSPRAAALRENALVRGRFMEMVSEGMFAEAERDSLFVTGLFSMLDLVLQIPLSTAIQPLNLPTAIEAAILHGTGPYAPFLNLALACESPHQDRIEVAAAQCGVDVLAVNAWHFEALAWVRMIQF